MQSKVWRFFQIAFGKVIDKPAENQVRYFLDAAWQNYLSLRFLIVFAEMTEWQTCKIEGLVSNRSCGFKSHFPHPYSFPIVGSCFFVCTKDSPLVILQWIPSIALILSTYSSKVDSNLPFPKYKKSNKNPFIVAFSDIFHIKWII